MLWAELNTRTYLYLTQYVYSQNFHNQNVNYTQVPQPKIFILTNFHNQKWQQYKTSTTKISTR